MVRAGGFDGRRRPNIWLCDADIAQSDDGSIDVYSVLTVLAAKVINDVQNTLGNGWFAGTRFYRPTETFFDESCVLPNIERLE